MDWEKIWDILKKIAVVSNIGAFVLAVVWFLYTIRPSTTWATQFDTEAGMRLWLPSSIIGGCLVLASIFNLVAFSISRRKRKLQKQIAELTQQKTKLEAKVNLALPDSTEMQRLTGEAQSLKTLNDQYDKKIGKLNSDAEEARREKLAAASNLHGIETERNDYRTWFSELSWLKPTIKEQQRDISDHVKVIAARPCLLNLKERVVIIDLVIRNDSFFDIAIEPDAVAGKLSTREGLLNDPAKAFVDLTHPPIKNLKPTEEKMFAIIQRLLRTEAEEIEDTVAEDSDGYFWLGNLNIPISVRNAEPLDVGSKPLRINSDVEHVYFREFGSLTFDGEVITPRELIRDVESLPFPERARIYRELSKVYGESLWRLNEAEQDKDPEELANESIRRNTRKI